MSGRAHTRLALDEMFSPSIAAALREIERVERGEEIIISRAGHPVAKVIPLTRRVDRAGRGSLRGTLVITEDWDSDEVNNAIAHDFGLTR